MSFKSQKTIIKAGNVALALNAKLQRVFLHQNCITLKVGYRVSTSKLCMKSNKLRKYIKSILLHKGKEVIPK